MAFLPELVLVATMLGVFAATLSSNGARTARLISFLGAAASIVAAIACFHQQATLFDGAYRVDGFSQVLKLVFGIAYALVLWLSVRLPDVREEIHPEYYLMMAVSVGGLMMLVSSVELITLVVALEVSAFPLYLMVAMRQERAGQRVQMESAIKYVMFGVAANGVMLFGMSYLFGLTGTTSLPLMAERLRPVLYTPAAMTGLVLACCGFFYKLAIFPFHFWTPDVYQGASNETTGMIATLPKLGAMAVLIRLTGLGGSDHQTLPLLLAALAVASMVYGNLIALVQTDLKRLLAFSGIAHAGYAMVGIVALNQAGYAAALYYLTGYLLMVLACFVVICQVSRDGINISLEDLAGLHRRSPLLAVTLLVGVFALAGIPPFVGFTGKLTLLMAAFAKGYTWLVIVAVINTAIAIYYYLAVVREAWFRDASKSSVITLPASTRCLCYVLIAGIVVMGVFPNQFLSFLTHSLPGVPAVVSAGVAGH